MNDPLIAALTPLPHGPEFRFIDRVLSLDPGKSGEGEYTVRGTEPFLKGHFPGEPIFPGVLMIEAAAQLAGIVAQSAPSAGLAPKMKLAAIRNAKILGAPRPGETLTLQARLLVVLEQLVQAEVAGFVGGTKVLETQIVLSGSGAAAT
jgi:3-hydroxyacyl-[acyl-carrier-protein] dehydratase